MSAMAAQQSNRPGPDPLPEGQRRSVNVGVSARPDEAERWTKAARLIGKTRSTWMAELAEREARKILAKHDAD